MFKGDHLCLRGTTYHDTSCPRLTCYFAAYSAKILGGPLTTTQVIIGGRCSIMQLTQINVVKGYHLFLRGPLATTQVILEGRCGIMWLSQLNV
jgi:hypothetical protein